MTTRNQGEKEYLVSTILNPDERMRVDAVGLGLYHTHHRTQVKELIADVCRQRARAVVISVGCYETSMEQDLANAVLNLPQIAAVALLSRMTKQTPEALLRLGKNGIRRVIDVRLARGWHDLREYLSREFTDPVEQHALERLAYHGLTPGMECWAFFDTLFRISRTVASVRMLAHEFHLLPSTLMSRFFRAGLPAPKQYLATVRLVRAAYLLENQGFSVANVANHLEYSSPQSFGRHVRAMLNKTAMGFRQSYGGDEMMRRFEKELIVPYLAILREFQPLSRRVGMSPAHVAHWRSRD